MGPHTDNAPPPEPEGPPRSAAAALLVELLPKMSRSDKAVLVAHLPDRLERELSAAGALDGLV